MFSGVFPYNHGINLNLIIEENVPVYPPKTNILLWNTTAEWWYRGAGGVPFVTALQNKKNG